MSKRTERMSRSAAEEVIHPRMQSNSVDNAESEFEVIARIWISVGRIKNIGVDLCYLHKMPRADRMAEKLYEKGRKDVKRCRIRNRSTDA